MFRRRIRPRPGQESVWDYPRPPRVEPAPAPVRVVHNSVDLANSERVLRVLETASPPTFYIPREDVAMKYLHATTGHTVCEFKGVASYFDLEVKARDMDVREPQGGVRRARRPHRLLCRTRRRGLRRRREGHAAGG